MAENRLRHEQIRGLHHLIMDRGPNALDRPLVDDLRGAVARLADRGGEPILLRSSHPTIFSPGWDLKVLAHAPREELQTYLAAFNRLIYELFSYPGSTAAAVNGHAVAGGCLLAMACDLRVMAAGGARIGLSEVNLGVPVPAGCVRMLRARLAPWVVDQLIFGGDGITADEARVYGLVQKTSSADGVVRVAEQALSSLAAKPRSAVMRSKAFLFAEVWQQMEAASAAEDDAFLDSWFEPETLERVQSIARSLSS
jgi:enoyl-CoA hydratase